MVYSAFPMRQTSLFPTPPKFHGGQLARGKRKTRRPLSTKSPLHLVLKSKQNLFRHRALIEAQVKCQSENAKVRLYDLAVAVDHVHLALLIPGRREYRAFVRALTGILARKLGAKLWALLPFTRLANWGKDYERLKKYFRQNREEASGERAYRPRKDWYEKYFKERAPRPRDVRPESSASPASRYRCRRLEG